MSYEVSIKRATGKPQLTADDFRRIVTEDSSLSGGEREPITWTDPTSGQARYINVTPESGELSTDDTRGDDASICRFLDKLRSIASKLDARVIGEGEDLSPERQPEGPPTAAGAVGGIIVSVLAFPFIALLFVVRLPWIIWKLKKELR